MRLLLSEINQVRSGQDPRCVGSRFIHSLGAYDSNTHLVHSSHDSLTMYIDTYGRISNAQNQWVPCLVHTRFLCSEKDGCTKAQANWLHENAASFVSFYSSENDVSNNQLNSLTTASSSFCKRKGRCFRCFRWTCSGKKRTHDPTHDSPHKHCWIAVLDGFS